MAAGEAGGGHWLARVWPVLQQASGVTVVVMLLMLALVYVEMKRVHRNNEALVHSLLATKDEHLSWLKRFANCQPTEQAK